MTDIEKLYKRVYELEVFKKGSFTLSSGKKSNYYIDGRLISLDPSGSEKISKIFINKINFKIDKIGGPATAAIPLISSLSSYLKHLHNKEVPGFYIRPSSKEHGLTNKIEGSLNKEENDILNKIELNQDEYTWFNKFKKKYIKSFTKKCEKEYVDTGIFKLKELKKELNSWIDSIL